MTQRQLNRAVARAAGESVSTIARMGFGLVDPLAAQNQWEPADFGPNLVDWDERDAQRFAYLPQRMAAA
jgi:hypothetical protein